MLRCFVERSGGLVLRLVGWSVSCLDGGRAVVRLFGRFGYITVGRGRLGKFKERCGMKFKAK